MNKPRGFDKRLQHSIELMQKAEKIALTYDAEDGFFLAFSGGKDSQALYHCAVLAGVKFRGHMNFTSVDPPQVIRFVRQHYPDVVTHAPSKSIYQLAIDRGILPSMRIRWCCADLKESAGAGKVTLIGIRAQESTRRAKRHEVEVSNRKFSGDLDGFYAWREEEIAKQEEKLIRKMKREGKKVNEDYFSVEKPDEVRCINGKDSILISPIFEWSEQDVWYFLNEVVKVPHCELYDQGYKRIGCILCPMSSYRQKVKEMKMFPHVKRGWIRAIKEIRRGGGISRRIYLVEHQGRLEFRSDGQPTAQALEFTTHTTAIGGIQSSVSGTASAQSPPRAIREFETIGIEKETKGYGPGFLSSPLVSGNTEGQDNEDVIAEAIFDWWISGKSYSKWFADRFLQQKLEFDEDVTLPQIK